jgi:hypothetical protein
LYKRRNKNSNVITSKTQIFHTIKRARNDSFTGIPYADKKTSRPSWVELPVVGKGAAALGFYKSPENRAGER